MRRTHAVFFDARWMSGLLAVLVLGCGGAEDAPDAAAAEPTGTPTARFDWFSYTGRDDALEGELSDSEYRNPILSGFYPDPSITQAGDAYYLVNSTFAYFPGIPVFESRDLVNWTQLGNVIDRPGMLDFSGLGLSRGVFAPTIEYHEGTFYVANTCVDCGGNFIVTADDPAGPWSDPIWLPEVGGIDPSLYFDDDGKVYVMNNDAPAGEPRYEGHRAVWIREVDPETFQSIGEPVVLIDGGVRPEENPIWIEGPHIYQVGDYYYLSAAEGGTAINHSQVVLRADNVLGPYTPYEGNPILTQRHLDPDRPNPITSVGHADFVTDDEGNWWVTFLGVRPYEGDFYNTGRETFLMAVEWKDGWPVITEMDEEVPYVGQRPELPLGETPPVPMSGNFSVREEFDSKLGPHWLFVRVPEADWWKVSDGGLEITPRSERLGQKLQPSVITRRQQHLAFEAETALNFAPTPETEAGLVAMQSDEFWFKLGISETADGETVVRLRRRAGTDDPEDGDVVAEDVVDLANGQIRFHVEADGADYRFAYGLDGAELRPIGGVVDGKLLSTQVATGFVGATIGMYAEEFGG